MGGIREMPPCVHFAPGHPEPLRQRLPGGGPAVPHPLGGLRGKAQAELSHDVGVGVVIDHRVHLVRAHDAEIAELTGRLAPGPARGVIARDLHEDLRSVVEQPVAVRKHPVPEPDAVRHRRRDVNLRVPVLPHVADLLAVDRAHRIARPAVAELFRPLEGARQCAVAVFEKILRRASVGKEVKREAVGFGVPPGHAPVVFAGQPLRADIQGRVEPVVGLVQMKQAEADPLLIGGIALDGDIHVAPDGVPIGSLRFPRGGKPGVGALRRGPDAVAPDGVIRFRGVLLGVMRHLPHETQRPAGRQLRPRGAPDKPVAPHRFERHAVRTAQAEGGGDSMAAAFRRGQNGSRAAPGIRAPFGPHTAPPQVVEDVEIEAALDLDRPPALQGFDLDLLKSGAGIGHREESAERDPHRAHVRRVPEERSLQDPVAHVHPADEVGE